MMALEYTSPKESIQRFIFGLLACEAQRHMSTDSGAQTLVCFTLKCACGNLIAQTDAVHGGSELVKWHISLICAKRHSQRAYTTYMHALQAVHDAYLDAQDTHMLHLHCCKPTHTPDAAW